MATKHRRPRFVAAEFEVPVVARISGPVNVVAAPVLAELSFVNPNDPAHDEEPDNSSSHPVIAVLAQRKLSGSKPGRRNDNAKVCLVIEGGGMRGCVRSPRAF
eukprot:tig00000339_g24178.t1